MINLPGKLSVKSISGRNGAFSVGKLSTSVGEFVVKDAMLDQFSEGSYDGEFLISKIFPHSYSVRGNIVVEVRAIVDQIHIAEANEGEQHENGSAVPDPLDEEKAGGTQVGASKQPGQPAPEETKVESSTGEKDAASQQMEFGSEHARLDYELFGDLYTEVAGLYDGIKLDPTVDRAKFRAQRDRLKELGYSFDSPTQSWVLKS